jgi:hypothetical protein
MSATCIVASMTEPSGCVTVPTPQVSSSAVPVANSVPHLVPAAHVAVSSLAFTGSDIREIALVGAAAVLTGLALRFKRTASVKS